MPSAAISPGKSPAADAVVRDTSEMRMAFVGKGGAGKSAIAGTFVRFLARRGDPVLAVDCDPLPGLGFSLGLPVDDSPPIPETAVRERREGEDGPRWRLDESVDPLQAVEQWSVPAPDGVRFLQFGKTRHAGANLWRPQTAFLHVVRGLPDDLDWHVIGDLPGGTRQAFTGWGSFADTILVVVEPTTKSLLSGRRLARLALAPRGDKPGPRVMAVASKVREPGDTEMIAAATGMEVVGSIPWDEDLAEAERLMLAPLDFAPHSPAVQAVEFLVDQLCEERVA
ncbi:MAG: nucleotide-binding protein [Acidimicrobiales bacterium]